ncbi:hypothetical protein C1Y40_00213 [Mycobacterium talmoniae]|uniref:Uncharacterized protein n=1 Tax=Mycobacterium talmoniae TaxID=1858794 RepID=A0A2S8BSE0_9MYCO|nr:hypothetical protein C1Y40_00213 [Mycobacterium talmoniae]
MRQRLGAGHGDRARSTDAALTAALSMIRLITIASVSAGTATGSAATSAIFQASCSVRGKSSALRRVRTECINIIHTLRSGAAAEKTL